ncbi:4Fe-4S dicluster domain-containing protein [Clostridium sp. MCC353]|uniref:4Fe-4S binding protein n=1 Tax=Clostridium sp. MCC353 TaxID=2592646 RepID=UPI001C029082|nr:4Fe-4S binding protein [Clostridium sp. MCC353]MBT9776171.1 4Fe-4S dicluster domain-containing protein [Clostridium sp. MCC353]
MKKILVDPNRCRGCRLCRKGCTAQAIQIRNHQAVIGRQCIFCQRCITNCPFHALSLWEDSPKSKSEV